jgi:FixJ family two-component response regulator
MIYIIDDDQCVRDGFSLLLSSAGFRCSSYKSAEEFLTLYNPGDDDLLLLDMYLPGMDGCDLLENLTNRKTHLSVIIITAYDEVKSRNCAKNYGVLAYLRKPIDGNAILDLVKFNVALNHNY